MILIIVSVHCTFFPKIYKYVMLTRKYTDHQLPATCKILSDPPVEATKINTHEVRHGKELTSHAATCRLHRIHCICCMIFSFKLNEAFADVSWSLIGPKTTINTTAGLGG